MLLHLYSRFRSLLYLDAARLTLPKIQRYEAAVKERNRNMFEHGKAAGCRFNARVDLNLEYPYRQCPVLLEAHHWSYY